MSEASRQSNDCDNEYGEIKVTINLVMPIGKMGSKGSIVEYLNNKLVV